MSIKEVEVWLDVGRGGRCFTYLDGNQLGIEAGDIVVVRLKGRVMHGLVVQAKESLLSPKETIERGSKRISLTNVEALLQKAAVESDWREWINAVALRCHISPFKMLKAALPPGWLGQGKRSSFVPRMLFWVALNNFKGDLSRLSSKQQDLHAFLLRHGEGMWQKDLLSNGFSFSSLKSCESCGLINRQKRPFHIGENEFPKSSSFLKINEDNHLRSLTNEQANALELFNAQPPGSTLLLWGVTGSGKTEVYLRMVEKEFSCSRHSLILTPEIGLIPQLVDRCKQRFGNRVLEYHSACSDKQRITVWRYLLNATEPVVVVGTRSSIFLPLFPLGLIVLDEEHDNSYKQDSPMPCYHARGLHVE